MFVVKHYQEFPQLNLLCFFLKSLRHNGLLLEWGWFAYCNSEKSTALSEVLEAKAV